jgi:hypothetical protein
MLAQALCSPPVPIRSMVSCDTLVGGCLETGAQPDRRVRQSWVGARSLTICAVVFWHGLILSWLSLKVVAYACGFSVWLTLGGVADDIYWNRNSIRRPPRKYPHLRCIWRHVVTRLHDVPHVPRDALIHEL